MGKTIEVGCWAVIYKPFPCCGTYSHWHGLPFVVETIHSGKSSCYHCNYVSDEPLINNADTFDGAGWHISMCKRIDPPAEETASETEKKVEA